MSEREWLEGRYDDPRLDEGAVGLDAQTQYASVPRCAACGLGYPCACISPQPEWLRDLLDHSEASYDWGLSPILAAIPTSVRSASPSAAPSVGEDTQP